MKQQNQAQDYKKIKLLGQGTYGKAFLVERKSDGLKCVIKQIEMSHMTEEERKEAQKEANILQMLNHHNIIKYHEQYKTKKGRLCIVMDYADGGDLNQVITKARSNIPEEQILNWLLQLSLALNYVHNKNIIHRDIKAQNVFLSSNNIVKLADFGIARILSCTKDKAQTFIGTPYYLAPELVNSDPYTTKADIWSLGVLIYHLCTLKPPFEADNIPSLMIKISRGQFPPIPQIYSKELRYLVNEMLTVDHNQRPSALQILEKPLIKGRAMSLMSETIAMQVQQDTQGENDENVGNKQQPQKKVQAIPQIDNDRRYGFKDNQKNNNMNIPQTRFYSPQHNMEQRNLGFNNNPKDNIPDKLSYNDLPVINGDDAAQNRPKLKAEALKYFKAQDEYFKQNINQQANQENKRQLNRVESLNEFSNNNNLVNNNNINKKIGYVKQPSFQPVTQQENNVNGQQHGMGFQNYPKKSFRVHSPVHHKMPSPNNRFSENKSNQNYSQAASPVGLYHNFSNANENYNQNTDQQQQLNNKQSELQQQFQNNQQKGPINNNFLLANNNQNNVNVPQNSNISNQDRNSNLLDFKFQNNIVNGNNAQPQQNRIGSPGTRLPHLNYQPPQAKVKHGSNFSAMDNLPQTPQANINRRNLEKIQKPSILSNKNEVGSPKFNQRPPSAFVGLGNYNNLQKKQVVQIGQECHSPYANVNKLNLQGNKNQQQLFYDALNNQEQQQQQQMQNIQMIREQLQSANPTSNQNRLKHLQPPNLLNLNQQIIQQQNLIQNQQQQQQSTKETQKSEDSSESSQDDQTQSSQNHLGKSNQYNSSQQQQQNKKFVIKKGGLQGILPGNHLSNQQPQGNHHAQPISSANRINSQPTEEHFIQVGSQIVNFNTQPTLLNSQNIQLLCVDSDISQRNTPKSENVSQATINSSIVNTQLLKKSDYSQISATQASQYEATQSIKSNAAAQSAFEDLKTAKRNIHSIKQVSSSDNIDNVDSQFKASSSTSSQNSQPNKVGQLKNQAQNAYQQDLSEAKGKRKDSQSDEDIRIFDSVDSQKSVKSPTNIIPAPQSHFSQNGSNNQLSSNLQTKNKLTASEDIDYQKRQASNLPVSASILNADNDKETKVERKLIVKLPLPFQENQLKLKEKEKRKNKNSEISPEVKSENIEQETDLEKMLNELNQMLTGNFDEQIQNLYNNGFELDTIEDKDDYLDEEEYTSNSNNYNFGSSPQNNIGSNQNIKLNFNSNIPSNISCIAPAYNKNSQNKMHNSGNHNNNNSNIGSNSNLNGNSSSNQNNNYNNQSVVSKAIAASNINQLDLLSNSEDRVKLLRQSLEKEIGTMHFSKVYKMALQCLNNVQSPLESSEFFQNLKVMFPSCNNQEIQRYTTLFHTLVMLEQD
ncbi:hypothetical protein ABPG72_002956 [Tetrahymena utriculariae]